MQLDPMTRAYARLALREAVRNHLLDPNVGLIDLGHPEHEGKIAWDEIAIRVHVREKLAGAALAAAAARGDTRPIPPSIQGFPTDVPEARYHLQRLGWSNGWQVSSADSRLCRDDPMRGGISISDAYHYTAGTLGCLVADRVTGEPMILSNWHVLVSDWGNRIGQPIYQPGRLDGGNFTDAVATLTRDAMASNLDAAVATLTGARAVVDDQLGLGPVTGVTGPELDMQVVKSSRTSGITHGIVEGVDGTLSLPYSSLVRIIRHIVTIGPLDLGVLSSGGDSGALWLEAQTRRAAGLHFAGSDNPPRALALDISSVLDALNVDIPSAEKISSAPTLSALEWASP
jgi:endonuclease G